MCDVAAVARRRHPPRNWCSSRSRRHTPSGRRAATVPKPRPAPLPPSVAPSPDDAATMTKIARAIRNGFAGGREGAAPQIADADEPDVGRDDRSRAGIEAGARATHAAQRHCGRRRDHEGPALRRHRQRALSRLHVGHSRQRAARTGADQPPAGRRCGRPTRTADLQAAEIDLNALAQGSVSAMLPLAEEAGLKLMHDFHRPLPHVSADPTAVKQILFNLISNAIKFTPRGGEVRVVTGLGYDRSIFVAVQDSGTGMSADDRGNGAQGRGARQSATHSGRRSRHRPAARSQPCRGERRPARDRQRAQRRDGGRSHIPARSRRRPHGGGIGCHRFRLDDF